MRSCQPMSSDHGYAKAKKLLQGLFGNEYTVCTALENGFAWPSIKAGWECITGLLPFSMFMLKCHAEASVYARVGHVMQHASS